MCRHYTVTSGEITVGHLQKAPWTATKFLRWKCTADAGNSALQLHALTHPSWC